MCPDPAMAERAEKAWAYYCGDLDCLRNDEEKRHYFLQGFFYAEARVAQEVAP